MTTLAAELGAARHTDLEAAYTQLFGGQLTEPGWPTTALSVAAELEYRSGLAKRYLQLSYGIDEPTVRDTLLQVPIGDAGLAGKVLHYTIHAAATIGHPDLVGPLSEAMEALNIPDVDRPRTSLLMLEAPAIQTAALIDAASQAVPAGARIVTGKPGQPPLLTDARISELAGAFRGASGSPLPASIRGLHKADLLVGKGDGSRWAGVSLKSGKARPETDPGVPLAITVDDRKPTTTIRRAPSGLVVVELGNASTLMTKRHDAFAAMQHAYYKLHGTARLAAAGRTIE